MQKVWCTETTCPAQITNNTEGCGSLPTQSHMISSQNKAMLQWSNADHLISSIYLITLTALWIINIYATITASASCMFFFQLTDLLLRLLIVKKLWENSPLQLLRARGDDLRCLLLFDQNYKTHQKILLLQKYFIISAKMWFFCWLTERLISWMFLF